MNQQPQPKPLISAGEIKQIAELNIFHPLNPNSEIHGICLSELVGLERLGFSLMRIPPGKESFIYHSHHCEEEFVYVLTGKGIAEIDGEEFEVGAGDFMGFPTPSVAHHLRNPFTEDLVYLMGGERREVDIADFPKQQKRLIRIGDQADIVDMDALKSVSSDSANTEELTNDSEELKIES